MSTFVQWAQDWKSYMLIKSVKMRLKYFECKSSVLKVHISTHWVFPRQGPPSFPHLFQKMEE